MKYLIIVFLLLSVVAQAMPTDTLPEIRYLYKGEPFPFDSGVVMSDRQYQFIYRNDRYKDIKSTVSNAILQPPKVTFVDREVRKKGDGNKVTYFSAGGGAGVILTILILLIAR